MFHRLSPLFRISVVTRSVSKSIVQLTQNLSAHSKVFKAQLAFELDSSRDTSQAAQMVVFFTTSRRAAADRANINNVSISSDRAINKRSNIDVPSTDNDNMRNSVRIL